MLSWIDTVFSDLLNMNLTKKNANVNMFNKWNLTQKNANAFFIHDEMETQNNIIFFTIHNHSTCYTIICCEKKVGTH